MVSCEGGVGEIRRLGSSLGFLSSAGGGRKAGLFLLLGLLTVTYTPARSHGESPRFRHRPPQSRFPLTSPLLSDSSLIRFCRSRFMIISLSIDHGFDDGIRKTLCEQGVRWRTHKVQVQSAYVVTDLSSTNLAIAIPECRVGRVNGPI